MKIFKLITLTCFLVSLGATAQTTTGNATPMAPGELSKFCDKGMTQEECCKKIVTSRNELNDENLKGKDSKSGTGSDR